MELLEGRCLAASSAATQAGGLNDCAYEFIVGGLLLGILGRKSEKWLLVDRRGICPLRHLHARHHFDGLGGSRNRRRQSRHKGDSANGLCKIVPETSHS